MATNEPIGYVIYGIGGLVLLAIFALLLKRFLPEAYAWSKDLLCGTLDIAAHQRTLQRAWKDLKAVRKLLILLLTFSLVAHVANAVRMWEIRSEINKLLKPPEFETFFRTTFQMLPQMATGSVEFLYSSLQIPDLAYLTFPFLLVGLRRFTRRVNELNRTIQSPDEKLVARCLLGAGVFGTMACPLLVMPLSGWSPPNPPMWWKETAKPIVFFLLFLAQLFAWILTTSIWRVCYLAPQSNRSERDFGSNTLIPSLLTRLRPILLCTSLMAAHMILNHIITLMFLLSSIIPTFMHDLLSSIVYYSQYPLSIATFLLVPTLLIIVRQGVNFRDGIRRTLQLYRAQPSSIAGFLLAAYIASFLYHLTQHTLSQMLEQFSWITTCILSGLDLFTILFSALFWAGLLRRIEETETSVAPQPVAVPH